MITKLYEQNETNRNRESSPDLMNISLLFPLLQLLPNTNKKIKLINPNQPVSMQQIHTPLFA